MLAGALSAIVGSLSSMVSDRRGRYPAESMHSIGPRRPPFHSAAPPSCSLSPTIAAFTARMAERRLLLPTLMLLCISLRQSSTICAHVSAWCREISLRVLLITRCLPKSAPALHRRSPDTTSTLFSTWLLRAGYVAVPTTLTDAGTAGDWIPCLVAPLNLRAHPSPFLPPMGGYDSTISIRRPSHRMQFTAIEFPYALYCGPSAAMQVFPSRSHSPSPCRL